MCKPVSDREKKFYTWYTQIKPGNLKGKCNKSWLKTEVTFAAQYTCFNFWFVPDCRKEIIKEPYIWSGLFQGQGH